MLAPLSISLYDPAYLDILPDVVDHHNEAEAGRTVADGGEVEIQHPLSLTVSLSTDVQRGGGGGCSQSPSGLF